MSNSYDAFYIGGKWAKPASSSRFHLINAATEEEIGSVPEASNADIDRAVAAARHAFDHSGWAALPAADRAAALKRFVAALSKRSPDLARAVSSQNGMPIGLSQMLEGQFSIGLVDYYAGLATSVQAEEKRPSQMGTETIVTRRPIGVVAAIVPWNFPVTLALSKIAPALAAGCTVVVKPSPGTILDSYVMAEAAQEAQIPAGVINWVAADRDVGAYLVAHPGVDKVAFTGSTAAGKLIARTCGELLRPVTLELGGKSAAIILDDADLNAVMQGLPMASLLNNGQACYNGTRVLAPESRYAEVVEALAGLASSLVVGDPLDPATHVGPMASSAHRDRVESYIAKGKTEARLVAGGGRPKGQARGWFVQPTVFADVDNSAVIAQEEIFGPVLSVIKYKDDADAVRIANDSAFGLGGSVWTSSRERGLSVAKGVFTGTIGINGYLPSIGSPFGGVRGSGLGRELGPEAIDGYLQYKSTYVFG
ncbi:MAG: aldehyde dehydrogenase [Rudaea sp.]|uniref:aldehyde dehydrogenase n=1 Tax=Rudaea sp. TaxID=2136325 RepID=UPI0039E36E7F